MEDDKGSRGAEYCGVPRYRFQKMAVVRFGTAHGLHFVSRDGSGSNFDAPCASFEYTAQNFQEESVLVPNQSGR